MNDTTTQSSTLYAATVTLHSISRRYYNTKMENTIKHLFLELIPGQRRGFNVELENIKIQCDKANHGELTTHYPHYDVYGNQRKIKVPRLKRNRVYTIGYRSSLTARIHPRAEKAQHCGPCLGFTTSLTTSPRTPQEPSDLFKKLEEADLPSK